MYMKLPKVVPARLAVLFEFATCLYLIHFFIQKISSKFIFHFFKIFLKVPRNIFKIFRNFPGYLINFPNHFTISEKYLPISPKISSLLSKFNQKFFKITLKCLRLHKTFSKFTQKVSSKLTLSFFKIIQEFHKIPSKSTPNFCENSQQSSLKIQLQKPNFLNIST